MTHARAAQCSAAKLLPCIAVLLTVLLAACYAAPPAPQPAPSTPAAPTAAKPRSGFTLVQLYSENGDLLEQLRGEVAKAQSLGQTPFALLTAAWCLSCRKVEQTLRDPLVRAAMQGVYLIKLDVDDWARGFGGSGFSVRGIPVIYRLNSQGRPTVDILLGSVWGADTPGNMARTFQEYFHRPY